MAMPLCIVISLFTCIHLSISFTHSQRIQQIAQLFQAYLLRTVAQAVNIIQQVAADGVSLTDRHNNCGALSIFSTSITLDNGKTES